MLENMSKPNFDKIREINSNGKETLEKYFGKKYIVEKKREMAKGTLSDNGDKFKIFTIQRDKAPIYKAINSESDLNTIKKNILDEYKKMVDLFLDLFDRVEEQLDDNSIHSLEIISNTLENRQRKLNSTLNKFIINETWDISKIQKEFSLTLQKSLQDILESTIPSISNGAKTNSIYDEVIQFINDFLIYLGIYTTEYKVGDKCDDNIENLNIQVSKNSEIKDKSFQDTISSVESLAYLFEDDFPVLEATVTVWKVS